MEKNNYYAAEDIYLKGDEKLVTFRNPFLLDHISWTLSKIKKEIVDKIFNNCYFLITTKEDKGSYFHAGFFNDKCLICFSDSYLYHAKNKEVEFTILHEIAHYYLGHKNHLTNSLSDEERQKQESDADEQVRIWLSSYEKSEEVQRERYQLYFKD